MSGHFTVHETACIKFEKVSMSIDGKTFWRKLVITDKNGEKFGFTMFSDNHDSLDVLEDIEFVTE